MMPLHVDLARMPLNPNQQISEFVTSCFLAMVNGLGDGLRSRFINAWFARHQLSLEFVFKDEENWSDFPAFALADLERDIQAGRLIPISPF
jgi:hypothetical protein